MITKLHAITTSYLTVNRWVVGFSGGVDSLTLLHSLIQIPHHPPVVALHINHQIHPQADQWAETCRVACESMGVPFYEEKVQVLGASNVEQKARDARYAVFEHFLQQGDVLMLGHHQQDQIETFFYRLFRGAGLKGLSAMPKTRELGKGRLLRPVLTVPKADIGKYAATHQLVPAQDDSNFDQAFDRNYLRHSVLPTIDARWPKAQAQIEKALSHLHEASQLLNELAKEDLENISHGEGFEPWIAYGEFSQASKARQKSLLMYWLLERGVQLSSSQFDVLLNEVLLAEADAMPELVVGPVVLRRFKQKLYITKTDETKKPDTWNSSQSLVVSGYPPLKLTKTVGMLLSIRYRRDVRAAKIADNRPTKKINTLLQTLEIPYWRRDSTPLIFWGEQLVAIGEVFISTYGEVIFKHTKIALEEND